MQILANHLKVYEEEKSLFVSVKVFIFQPGLV